MKKILVFLLVFFVFSCTDELGNTNEIPNNEVQVTFYQELFVLKFISTPPFNLFGIVPFELDEIKTDLLGNTGKVDIHSKMKSSELNEESQEFNYVVEISFSFSSFSETMRLTISGDIQTTTNITETVNSKDLRCSSKYSPYFYSFTKEINGELQILSDSISGTLYFDNVIISINNSIGLDDHTRGSVYLITNEEKIDMNTHLEYWLYDYIKKMEERELSRRSVRGYPIPGC